MDMMPGLVGGFAFFAFLFPSLLLGLAIPYAVMWLRNAQGIERDPQVGIKVGLYFFYSLAILLIVNGVSILVIDAVTDAKAFRASPFDDDDWPGTPAGRGTSALRPAQRNAAALVLAGVFFTVIHFVLIKAGTNDRDFPATRRLFVGWRFAIHGLVVMGAATLLLMVLFQRNRGDPEAQQTLVAILLVWTPSWLVHFFLLRVYTDQGLKPRGAPNPFALGGAGPDIASLPVAEPQDEEPRPGSPTR